MSQGLVIEDLRVEHAGIPIVDGVSLTVAPGKVLGLVGESGSGKSLTVMSIPRLLPAGVDIAGGSISLGGQRLDQAGPETLRRIRGKDIGVVFQDPFTSLNPVRRVGDLLEETLRRHSGMTKAQARDAVVSALVAVGLPEPEVKARAFPHQLSGGQRQRVLIAHALANRPRLLIADEPTTALDPTVQIQILDLLRRSVDQAGAAAILVTHDLGAAAYLCDEVAVLYAGKVVEHGLVADVIARPAHPYTAALLACAPRLDRATPPLAIQGYPPPPRERGEGCAFAPRCGQAVSACGVGRPSLSQAEGRAVACFDPIRRERLV